MTLSLESEFAVKKYTDCFIRLADENLAEAKETLLTLWKHFEGWKRTISVIDPVICAQMFPTYKPMTKGGWNAIEDFIDSLDKTGLKENAAALINLQYQHTEQFKILASKSLGCSPEWR